MLFLQTGRREPSPLKLTGIALLGGGVLFGNLPHIAPGRLVCVVYTQLQQESRLKE